MGGEKAALPDWVGPPTDEELAETMELMRAEGFVFDDDGFIIERPPWVDDEDGENLVELYDTLRQSDPWEDQQLLDEEEHDE